MDLDGTLAKLIELGGSDVHLKVSSPPMGRVDGELVPLDERLLTESDLEAVLTRITERIPAKREHFFAAGDLDTAYMAGGRAPGRRAPRPRARHRGNRVG